MIVVHIDKALQNYEREIRYSFSFILTTLGLEFRYISKLDELQTNDILIYYSHIEPQKKNVLNLFTDRILFYIPCDVDLLQPGNLSLQKMKLLQREIILHKSVPVICKEEISSPIQYSIGSNYYYGKYLFDLVGNVFLNLVDYQKFHSNMSEKGYEIADSDRLFADYAALPFINCYLWMMEQSFLEAIEHMKEFFLIKKDFWPQSQKAAFAITHNVSSLQKWHLRSFLSSIKEELINFYKIRYVLKNIYRKLKFLVTNLEEYWNFDLIRKLETKYEIKSTYFWGAKKNRKQDFDYDLEEKEIRNEIVNNRDSGIEIALLATSDSYNNDILGIQKKRIIQLSLREKIGVRLINGKFDPYKTNELIQKNRFVYSSSLRFQSLCGFINGIGYPFHNSYKPRLANYELKFNHHCLEIPLNSKAENFIIRPNQNIAFEDSAQLLDNLFAELELFNGILTLDFSLPSFTELDYAEKLFEHILKKIDRKKHFQETLLNIADWWLKREKIELHEKKASVKLYFPDKIEHFSLKVNGNKKISHLDHKHYEILGETVIISKIEADSKITVFLEPLEKEEK